MIYADVSTLNIVLKDRGGSAEDVMEKRKKYGLLFQRLISVTAHYMY